MFLPSKANNEIYTLKEMLREPDRNKFVEAIEKEVRSMFDEGILKAVSKREMRDHYDKVRVEGLDVERQQIMMI